MVKLLIGHKGSGKIRTRWFSWPTIVLKKAQEASYLSIKIIDSCMSWII